VQELQPIKYAKVAPLKTPTYEQQDYTPPTIQPTSIEPRQTASISPMESISSIEKNKPTESGLNARGLAQSLNKVFPNAIDIPPTDEEVRTKRKNLETERELNTTKELLSSKKWKILNI
ncbi:MAG: hypothetical protein EBS86_09310, partial [Crocinitomicaceae bacterium]|nr:hypothetical protein [Crocinitomicaceae bacterium]